MRSLQVLLLCILLCIAVGCGHHDPPPPPITGEHRDAIGTGLIALGAKVTAEDEETIYASLRESHVQVGSVGGTVECTVRGKNDISDFIAVSASVTGHFLSDEETAELKAWLEGTARRMPESVKRIEFERLIVSLSRRPLRLMFSQKDPAEGTGE